METIKASSWDTVIVVYKWDDEGSYAEISPKASSQLLPSNAPVRRGVLFLDALRMGGNVTSKTQYSNKCRVDRARVDSHRRARTFADIFP
jgi:hypothetical protein